jgi:hypothetical protein
VQLEQREAQPVTGGACPNSTPVDILHRFGDFFPVLSLNCPMRSHYEDQIHGCEQNPANYSHQLRSSNSLVIKYLIFALSPFGGGCAQQFASVGVSETG